MTLTVQLEGLSDAVRSYLMGPHRLLIGGEWLEAADGRTFETVDPATGDLIAEVPLAGKEDINRAVAAARSAFEEGPWPSMAAAKRGVALNQLADLIEESSRELAELESLDNGKPCTMAKVVDLPSTVAHLRYYAGWPTKIEGETIPVTWPDMLVYTRREPVGVAGQIIPWNFPLLMCVWKLAPALAAGCTVVLKPAEQTPLSALRLGQLVQEAGIPDGVVNIVTGDGTTGAHLVDHPGVDKISFTGSTAVGKEIGAKCGRALKRVTLELGGKSPNIILPDADLDAAVKGAYQGIYFNTGQACQAGSRLYVPSAYFDEVVSRLVDRAKKTKLKPGLDPECQMGPVVSAEQLKRVQGYLKLGVKQGAKLVTGGRVRPDGTPENGYFVEPALFTEVDDSMRIAQEEIFGPVLCAMPYESIEEVARRANATPYGLAAAVWTRNVASAHRLAAMLKAGTVWINVYGIADPAAPFGGYKESGIGREMGHHNLDAYLETKCVWTNIANA